MEKRPETMLSDIEWINRTLQSMEGTYDKHAVSAQANKAMEFLKGIIWERERRSRSEVLLRELLADIRDGRWTDARSWPKRAAGALAAIEGSGGSNGSKDVKP